ncbi:Glutamate receptor ionotropic, delta-1 [Pseudolycoriella hygida]|uniref:Glutamate receptor ionotropic, delta-1 n=1 Tax=Pseudolycoriella hygida TaxID=35572 RepID=A0A9Q0N8W1_9DIPT|nr:Glutamate receptor ionotropic, delta-1 [Pseudolycoriella hygida]
MTGIELILTSLCVNITCNVIQLEKSPIRADYLLKTCITNGVCPRLSIPKPTDVALNTVDHSFTSSELKEFALDGIRQKLNGTKLTIVTLEDYPLSYKSENGTYLGVAFQIVEFLAEKFNFTYDVIVPPVNKVGSTDDMAGSLIETVNLTNPDMVAAFLPIISDARKYIDYSTTTLDEGEWIMIMKRPSESATGSGLLAPFNKNVWILIFVSLFAVGPIIYFLIIVRNKMTRDNSQKNYSLPHCVWFVYGALMKQGSTLSPVADSTRLLFATWWIFITILTSFYTANLTAFLTLSKFTLPINNVEDIIRSNKHFVAQRGSGVEYAIKNPNEALSQLQKMVDNKRGIFSDTANDSAALIRYVQKENYVYIRDRPAINHLIYQDYNYRKTISEDDEKLHCPFAVATKPFMTRKRAFAYPRNSNWSNLFDPELLHLVESGIVKYMLWENLPKAEICPQNLGGTERQLRNGDLLMTYQIMMAGFGTGVVVFFTEILFRCLLNRQKDFSVAKDPHNKKVDKLVVPTITPPPAYASLYNRSRNSNIWTLSETEQKNMEGITQFINGRKYMVVKGDDGQKKLIPLRTPSAALFAYSYTK